MGSCDIRCLISPQVVGKIRQDQQYLLREVAQLRSCGDTVQLAERLQFLESVLREYVGLVDAVLEAGSVDDIAVR